MQVIVGREREVELVTASVETSPGSGVFEVDDRLRVEEVRIGSDGDLSTARFTVRLDNTFDTAAARARYAADLRVIANVRSDEQSGDRVLFDGHAPMSTAKWFGGPGRAEESFGFVANGVYGRLARDVDAQIYGRRMRSGLIEDGLATDPGAWADRSVLVTAETCVFNPDGAGNRSVTPLNITLPDGTTRRVHIFTHDEDANGQPWTYLQALRYLVWFHAPRCGPVLDGNVFASTDAFIESLPNAGGSSMLIRRLLQPCASLVCEATNLVEALTLLADDAGIHLTIESERDGAGVRSSLRVWAAGDQTRRSLNLARGGFHPDGTKRFDVSSLAATDVLRANEVQSADIVWDDAKIINAPIVVGGVKAYEMTVPLVPGWPPTANLDNVAAVDRDNAKSLALTPGLLAVLGKSAELLAWFRMYHADGPEYAANRYVGRRWVLNEDGRFDGATYNRNIPFDDYQPFDFGTVTGFDITRRGDWSRRSRRFLPAITKTALGAGFGVYVEFSFDSGATWARASGDVSVAVDPTGVVFEAANTTTIAPPGVDPLEQNLWYAIIDQTFRVRVTAVIEGDERLIAKSGPDARVTPTLLTTSRIDFAPNTYGFATRLGTTNALASVNPGGDDIERDDSTAIALRADVLRERNEDRRVSAKPVVPWFDTRFDVGDEVAAVRGRGLSLATRTDGATRGPCVVGKRYRFDGGRWETELDLV